ncbi:hypothetical protein BAE44_0024745 [Dichanthelium oligosanthes]|uniref:WRKY domain-containing protein n=1 Tax=Dichanthelium oligosanthes TaxID=888268 RepID=A0A1E5UN45_9POAL|nr:hypothetical protein BAE44_0024745 [Dichanthelium oligosanthes]
MDCKSSSSSSSLTLPPCGHGPEMMETMRRQQELVMQLRALVLPLLHGIDDTSADIAVQLFDDVIGCNISVASKLEAGCLLMWSTGAGSGGGPAVELVDDKSLVLRTNNSTTTGDRTEEHAKPNSVGQKRRSYYRCAYRERNCLATKTIEQHKLNEGTSSSAMASEEIPKYIVVYYGDHTCQDHSIISTVQPPQLVNRDVQNEEMAQITTDAQEPEADLDLPALLDVFDNYLINWDDWKL